jgi:hypothetical protein
MFDVTSAVKGVHTQTGPHLFRNDAQSQSLIVNQVWKLPPGDARNEPISMPFPRCLLYVIEEAV